MSAHINAFIKKGYCDIIPEPMDRSRRDGLPAGRRGGMRVRFSRDVRGGLI